MASGGFAKFRHAKEADAAELARVQVLAWRESYTGMVPRSVLERMSIDDRTRAWEKIFKNPASADARVVYIVERGGEAIAFGSCSAQREAGFRTQGFDGEISSLYVLRAHQARGIGASLMCALAGELLSRGRCAASLWVLRHNSTARRFYEGLGGVLIGEKEDARDGAVLSEVAYGWRSLDALVRVRPSSVGGGVQDPS